MEILRFKQPILPDGVIDVDAVERKSLLPKFSTRAKIIAVVFFAMALILIKRYIDFFA